MPDAGVVVVVVAVQVFRLHQQHGVSSRHCKWTVCRIMQVNAAQQVSKQTRTRARARPGAGAGAGAQTSQAKPIQDTEQA